jgi:hypothetical protein
MTMQKRIIAGKMVDELTLQAVKEHLPALDLTIDSSELLPSFQPQYQCRDEERRGEEGSDQKPFHL